jgi:hypothetical protein
MRNKSVTTDLKPKNLNFNLKVIKATGSGCKAKKKIITELSEGRGGMARSRVRGRDTLREPLQLI